MAGVPRRKVVACLVVAAALAAIHGTLVHRPLGVTPDSVAYLTAARSLAEQGAPITIDLRTGLLVPLVHFPPAYPMALAAAGAIVGGPEPAADVLQTVLLALNLALVGWWVAWAAPRRPLWILAPLLCFAYPGFVLVHAMVWSEPLFILLALSSLALLARALERGDRGDLLLAAILASVAFLTRYVGVAVVAAGVAASLLHPIGAPARRRLRRAGGYLAAASVLPLLWLGRTALVGGKPAGRTMALHLPTSGDVASLADTLLGWLVPGVAPLAVRSAVALAVVSAGAWILFRERRALSGASPAAPAAIAAAGLHVVMFLVVVLLSRAALDAMVPLGQRMLAPLIPLFVVLLLLATDAAAQRSRALGLGAIAVVGLILAGQAVRTGWWLSSEAGRGRGYASDRWERSEAIRFVARLPSDTPIHSNQADAIFYLAGRRSESIPWAFGFEGRVEEGELTRMLAAWAADAARRDAVVVYFDEGRDEIPPLDRVERACRPRAAARLEDAVVLRCSGPEEERWPGGQTP